MAEAPVQGQDHDDDTAQGDDHREAGGQVDDLRSVGERRVRARASQESTAWSAASTTPAARMTRFRPAPTSSTAARAQIHLVQRSSLGSGGGSPDGRRRCPPDRSPAALSTATLGRPGIAFSLRRMAVPS